MAKKIETPTILTVKEASMVRLGLKTVAQIIAER